jgi:SlyX protein
MARPPVGLLAWALLAGGALCTPTAQAFECTPAKMNTTYRCHVAVHWDVRTIPYVVEIPAGTKTERSLLLSAIEAAGARWSSPQCTDLRFESRGTVASAPEALNGQILVRPQPDAWPYSDPRVVALTTVVHGFDTGKIISVELELNEANYTFGDAIEVCTDAYDLEATITHELGHALGFAHPCEEDETNFSGCGNALCSVVRERLLMADPSARLPTMWPHRHPRVTWSFAAWRPTTSTGSVSCTRRPGPPDRAAPCRANPTASWAPPFSGAEPIQDRRGPAGWGGPAAPLLDAPAPLRHGPPVSDLEQRVTELEIHLAHQDRLLAELNANLVEANQTIDLLNKRLERSELTLRDLLNAQLPANERPPHY